MNSICSSSTDGNVASDYIKFFNELKSLPTKNVAESVTCNCASKTSRLRSAKEADHSVVHLKKIQALPTRKDIHNPHSHGYNFSPSQRQDLLQRVSRFYINLTMEIVEGRGY